VEPLGRKSFDALGRLQGLYFQPVLPAELFLQGTFALELLDLIAMAQQFEVLPRREEQHQDEKTCDPDRGPQFALSLFVDFTDDCAVSNVLLDGVFERLHRPLCYSNGTITLTRSC
jgi:hypothetical protein